MKKRIVLLFVLISLVLLVAVTGTAFAGVSGGKPTDFAATMVALGVALGDVLPIPPPADVGENHRWLVRDRMVTGAVSGDITGWFTIVYDANVDVTQAGVVHGTLEFNCGPLGTINGLIRARTLPGEPVLIPYSELPPALQVYLESLYYAGYAFALLPIGLDGSVTLQGGTGTYEGIKGVSTCNGVRANTILAIGPPPYGGHIVAMLPSSVLLSGRWHQT